MQQTQTDTAPCRRFSLRALLAAAALVFAACSPDYQVHARPLEAPEIVEIAGHTRVLVVTATIDAGTPVTTLMRTPTRWLADELVPDDVALPSSTQFVWLGQLDETSVTTRAFLPGEQLELKYFDVPD